MSSTFRGAERMPADFYSTPPDVVRSILKVLGKWGPSRILEPAAGTGGIMRVVKKVWPNSRISGVELDEERARACEAEGLNVMCADFLKCQAWDTAHVDLILTNPPFSLAEAYVEQCCRIARETALLLPLPFLSGVGREELHRKHPCDVFVLPRRPAFVAVVKCIGHERGKRAGCGWRVTLPIEAERPKACPECGGRREVVTTDSTEYAWMLFGAGHGGRWARLELTD